MKIHRILTHVCLHYYFCYAKTSSPAVQKRHSKVYGNPNAPSLYSILLVYVYVIYMLIKAKKRYFFQKFQILQNSFFIARATSGTSASLLINIIIIKGIISVYATKMRIEGILKNISLSKSLIIGNDFISFKYWNNLKVVFNLKGIVSAISSDPPLYAKRYQCPIHNGLIK